MVLGFVYKALAGSIFTTFAIVPAIADPKGFAEALYNWLGNLSGAFGHFIGGVI